MRPPQDSLRAAVLFASAIALAACSSSGSTDVVVSSELPDPVPSPTPQVATPDGIAPTPEPAAKPSATPTEAPDTTGLVWTEVDLADALGAGDHSTIRLESVGDGRVMAMSFNDRGIDSILVTENSTEWTPVSVPAGFLPWSVDITGDRWLIQGWDSTLEALSTQILYSDDEGAIWTEIAVDLASFDGTAWVADAIVSGERIVVVAISDREPPDADQALEEDMEYESSVHLFFSDGGPAEPVTEFPGWFSGGHGASDGFHLIMSDSGKNYLLTSPDGRQWTRTTVDVEVIDSARNEIWTDDEGYTEYRIERFEGVYGWGQVLTLPEGIGRMPDLAVGPAGVAAVGGPEPPYFYSDDEFSLPNVRVEKDGFELRYNEPEGGITLWDLSEDAAVHVFDAETIQSQSETPPDGVREIEGEDGTQLVVFEDPETGNDLVTFEFLELAAAVDEARASGRTFDPSDLLVGWSLDGTDWEWQTLQEAFGLPEGTQDGNSFTEVEVAVGDDFVLAKVQTFVFSEADFDEDAQIGAGDGQSESTSAYHTAPASTSPSRWFIARVG